MGYDRDDRFGGSTGDRSRGSGRDQDADRYSYSGRGDYGRGRQGYDHDDRGFFERAGDEVRSWFGDEEAERRRRYDERFDSRDEGRRHDRERFERGDYGSSANRFRDDPGYRAADRPARWDSQTRHESGAYGLGVPPDAGYGWSNRNQGQQRGQDHDPGYRSWRDRQMDSFDRDYDEYRRENQSRFDSEFATWRQNREQQRSSLGGVKEHMEVVGSDGGHVGTVDHVKGDRILLTKADQAAGGHHHSIPSSWIVKVGDKVEISKTADQAHTAWKDEERNQGGNDRGKGSSGDGPHVLDRSFSGTY